MEGEMIYQFCLANYNNDSEFLNRIKKFLKVFKKSIGKIKKPLMSLTDFENLDDYKMILIDIIPPFYIPIIHEFDLIPNFNELTIFSMIVDIINKMDRNKKKDPNSKENNEPTIVIKLKYLVQLTPNYI